MPRWLWVGGGLLVAALWVFGLWRYLVHTHDEFFDASLAREANAVCAATKADLGAPPPASPSVTFEERAQRVETLTHAIRRMSARLRTLREPGETEAFDRWLELWSEVGVLGHDYAEAIRTGDPAVYEPAGNRIDEPTIELNQIARANGMEDCVF
jgi:hypothetical protein